MGHVWTATIAFASGFALAYFLRTLGLFRKLARPVAVLSELQNVLVTSTNQLTGVVSIIHNELGQAGVLQSRQNDRFEAAIARLEVVPPPAPPAPPAPAPTSATKSRPKRARK